MRTILRHLAAAFAALLLAGTANAQSTLRVALHSDLKIIDPIWTTALITARPRLSWSTTRCSRSTTSSQVKPQMVDKWDVSADKLTWTFTLRDGLEWHDGTPVTAEDCVASIKRWGARDSMGQKLMGSVADLTAPDAKTFTMMLKEPYGLVLRALGKPSANVPVHDAQARRRDRSQSRRSPTTTGSGPVHLQEGRVEARREGGLRQEPQVQAARRAAFGPGRRQGGQGRPRRVDLRSPTPQTQVNALHQRRDRPDRDRAARPAAAAGQGQEHQGLRRLQRARAASTPCASTCCTSRSTIAKIRQAALYALDQKEFLEANVGDPEYYKVCKSIFPCGSPLEIDQGLGGQARRATSTKAKAAAEGGGLRRHADRAAAPDRHRRPQPTSPPVAKPQLEKAGFKVDLQSMDWQTLVARRTKKDPPDARAAGAPSSPRGARPTSWIRCRPAFLNASCDKATFGWPCDAELEKLRDAFAQGDRSGQAEGDRRSRSSCAPSSIRPTRRSASSPCRRRSAPTSPACCRSPRWRCGTWRRSRSAALRDLKSSPPVKTWLSVSRVSDHAQVPLRPLLAGGEVR